MGGDADTPTLPMAALEIGEAIERAMESSDTLIALARGFADVAGEAGCEAVVGASAIGDRLAAATVAVAANGLRLYGPDTEAGSLLVVDGVLVTGIQISKAIYAARQRGVVEICSAVVREVPGARPAFPGVENVVVLNP